MTTEEWLYCFFIMTHVDSVTKNIQLLYILLYSYWLSISEHPKCSRRIDHIHTFGVSLGTKVNYIFLKYFVVSNFYSMLCPAI